MPFTFWLDLSLFFQKMDFNQLVHAGKPACV